MPSLTAQEAARAVYFGCQFATVGPIFPASAPTGITDVPLLSEATSHRTV